MASKCALPGCEVECEGKFHHEKCRVKLEKHKQEAREEARYRAKNAEPAYQHAGSSPY